MLKAVLITGLEKISLINKIHPILLPQPKVIQLFDLFYSLKTGCEISFYEVQDEEFLYFDFINKLKQFSNIKLNHLIRNDIDSDIPQQEIQSNDKLELNNEEYYLQVRNNNIIINSNSERGLFYGMQTLLQIMKTDYINRYRSTEKDDKKEVINLPELIIKDKPDFQIRGIAQDISRGQVFTIDNAKRLLDILGHYKLNFYFIYIEDMFAHPKYPEIGMDRGALTADELKELDVYAKKRFIEIVPIFECLGHVDNILMHDDYASLGEYPGAQCYNTQDENVYLFLEDFISELSRCLSTSFFHVGCDESFDFGKYKSKKYVKSIGKSKAYLDFYHKLLDIVFKYDKNHPIIYDDNIINKEKILKNLNRNFILMHWDYVPRKYYPEIKKIINAGYRVIASPSMLNWQRHYPDFVNSSENVHNLVKSCYPYKDKGCLGIVNSTWGDFRYYSLRENEILGAIYSGALSWNFNELNCSQFLTKFGFLFFGLNASFDKLYSELIEAISYSVTLYYQFNILLPPFFYSYLFKHPFPIVNYKSPFKKIEELEEIIDTCIQMINLIEPEVRFEYFNFEYIKFSCELAKTLCLKLKSSNRISKQLKNRRLSSYDKGQIIRDLEEVKNKFVVLKKKYEEFWMRAAKKSCLDVTLQLFDFVITCYNTKITEVRNGISFINPYLPSKWIWTDETRCPKLPRYFIKEFTIIKKIKKAVIQCIASTYMKVAINSEVLGNVCSRFSLSILPIIKRVRIFDITDLITIGRNIIVVKAYNFEGYKGAINVYGKILFEDGEFLEIKTDKNWYCYDKDIKDKDNWCVLNFNSLKWNKIKSYGAPPNLNGDLFITDILNGKMTITQDYFGMQGFFHNALKTFLKYFFGKYYKGIGRIVLRLTRTLIGIIINRINPYG